MRLSAWSAALFIVAAGCSPDIIPIQTAPVRGTATYDGKPLENYRVFFYAEDHPAQEPATGRVGADGTFVMGIREPDDGAMIGNNKVWLKWDPPFPEMEPGKETAIVIPPPTIKIPEKYVDADTSGITVEVPEDGLTDYKLELE